jgi:hypothetical protein
MTKTTPKGTPRPKSGQFTTYAFAVGFARMMNVRNGRGYRALRAQDGSFAVIFRPAVAGNRQRRVRRIEV